MITLRIWDYMFPCQCAHVSYAGGKKMYFAHCSSNVSSCFAVGASRRSYLFWPWNRTWIRPYCARPVGFLMIGPLVFYVCSLMSERTYFQNVFLFKSGWPYLVPFFQLHQVILLEQGWSLEVGMDMGLASVLILLWDLWDLSMHLMTGRQGDFTLGLVIRTKVFFAWLFSVLDVSYTCLTNFIVLLGTCTVSGEIVSFNFIFIKPLLKWWTPSGILIYSSTKN